MGARAISTFWDALFTGLFFVFSLLYGVDPSDINGTVLSSVVPAVIPASQPLVTLTGIVLTIVGFLGLVKLVRGEWDKDWQRGVAAFTGLFAGGGILINVYVAVLIGTFGLILCAF